jgi:threonine dehydratase
MPPAARTPLIRLSNLFPDGAVYAKCEFLAPSGCFKIHGAVSLLERLARAGSSRRLVVPSMGNTALGAATAAKALGFSMLGVVPASISRAKDEKLRALGVELIKIQGGGSELLAHARRIAQESGAYFVHPHLDPLWTDGYAAIVEQILTALPGCRSVVIPVGGGGLLMGLTGWLLRERKPVKLIGCEAYNFPTYARYDHERSPTIADGLVLDDPHPQVQQRIAQTGMELHLVGEDQIREAMARLYAEQGLVVEPSSAITAAFVRENRQELEGPVCVVFTGGNITREDFDRLIGDGG